MSRTTRDGVIAVGTALVKGDAGSMIDFGITSVVDLVMVSPADKRLQAAVAAQAEADLEADRARLDAAVKKLLDRTAGEEPTPQATAAIMEDWANAWRNSQSSKKRRLIMNALANSFDPELYQSGIVRTLYATLDALDYGDFEYLLNRIPRNGYLVERGTDPGGGYLPPSGSGTVLGSKFGSHERRHIDRLVRHELLCRTRIEGTPHATSLFPNGERLEISALGIDMCNFLRDESLTR